MIDRQDTQSRPATNQVQTAPDDTPNWAPSSGRLRSPDAPAGAVNINVAGKMATSPIQGFGKMWQKSYRVRLDGADTAPAEVIRVWKAHFPEFWPEGNRFYAPITGIAPGEVALLNLSMPGKQTLSTGVLVLYADDESFTLMTPQGHMLAGWITFSAWDDSGTTVVQTQVLIRASDPIYEVGLTLFGHRQEDSFWVHTLTQVAARFGVVADVETTTICVDSRRQWKRAGNVWHNAGIRTALYTAGAPVRRTRRALRSRSG